MVTNRSASTVDYFSSEASTDILEGNITTSSTNSTGNHSGFDDFPAPPKWIDISFNIIDGTALLGSLLLGLIIYKATKLRDTPGRLLMNNVISDALASATWLFFTFVVKPGYLGLDMEIATIIMRVMVQVFITVADHTLVVILFSLQISICYPMYYKLYCRGKFVFGAIASLWAFNILLCCSILFVESVEDVNSHPGSLLLGAKKHFVLFAVLKLLFNQIVPFVTITACYIRILIHLRVGVFQQSSNRNYIRQANSIILIYAIFFFSQLPMVIMEFLSNTILTGNEISFGVHMTFTFIAFLYVALKLPLFLFCFKSFREAAFPCCGQEQRRRHAKQTNNSPSIQPKNQKSSSSTPISPSVDEKPDMTSQQGEFKDIGNSVDVSREMTSQEKGNINEAYEEE